MNNSSDKFKQVECEKVIAYGACGCKFKSCLPAYYVGSSSIGRAQ